MKMTNLELQSYLRDEAHQQNARYKRILSIEDTIEEIDMEVKENIKSKLSWHRTSLGPYGKPG